MEKAILLAAAACCCTAAASVCQRMGAKSSQTPGFDIGLVFRLARRPVWLLGIASMIFGFVLQLTALRFGALALVQPILAAELVLVFGYLAIAGSGRVKGRDWLAAAAMSAGIGVFLRVASPSGGRLHAPGSSWLIAGLATAGVVLAALAVSFGLGRRRGASGTRRAAVLGAATGISWGFMAAVIKELSSHLGDGIGAVVSSWSLYLLLAAGAATMLLASHALAAGPLAASQPGFTILDPLSASLLGVFLFGEHIRTGAADLAGEAVALAVVVAGAAVLSHSCHLTDQSSHPSRLVEPVVSMAGGPRPRAGRAMAPAAGALDGRVTTGQETRVISAGRLIQAGPGPLFELIADPAQSPRWDGHDHLAAAPAGQHLRRTGDVSTIALTGGSIGDNHALAAAPSPAVWAPQDPLTAIGSEGASWRAAGGRRYCFAADSRECVIRGTELRALAEAGAGDGGVVMSPSSRRQ